MSLQVVDNVGRGSRFAARGVLGVGMFSSFPLEAQFYPDTTDMVKKVDGNEAVRVLNSAVELSRVRGLTTISRSL